MSYLRSWKPLSIFGFKSLSIMYSRSEFLSIRYWFWFLISIIIDIICWRKMPEFSSWWSFFNLLDLMFSWWMVWEFSLSFFPNDCCLSRINFSYEVIENDLESNLFKSLSKFEFSINTDSCCSRFKNTYSRSNCVFSGVLIGLVSLILIVYSLSLKFLEALANFLCLNILNLNYC